MDGFRHGANKYRPSLWKGATSLLLLATIAIVIAELVISVQDRRRIQNASEIANMAGEATAKVSVL